MVELVRGSWEAGDYEGRPLEKNFSQLQIARESDLEVELVVRNEKHLRAQLLDRRNLVRDREFFCGHSLVSFDAGDPG